MKPAIKAILSLFVLILCTSESFAASMFGQTITLTCPPAVDVTATNPQSASGTIDPITGNSSSPSASFQLKTNGTDAKYTYVVQAKLMTTGGIQTNAYTQNNSVVYLMLGNNSPSLYPTIAATTNIAGGSPSAANNSNVIAYPVLNSTNGFASATFTNNVAFGGNCYILTTGSSQVATLSQSIGSGAMAGTYSPTTDRAGTYQAVITFTANRNP